MAAMQAISCGVTRDRLYAGLSTSASPAPLRGNKMKLTKCAVALRRGRAGADPSRTRRPRHRLDAQASHAVSARLEEESVKPIKNRRARRRLFSSAAISVSVISEDCLKLGIGHREHVAQLLGIVALEQRRTAIAAI